MEQSARLIPPESNIKLVLRHSIRHDIANGIDGTDVELLPEGRIIANRLGESLEVPLGSISSSFSPRCIHTCNEIIDGYNNSHKKLVAQIIKTKLLQEPHIEDHKIAEDTWKKFGENALQKTIEAFVTKKNMPGMYDLDTSMNKLLDYVFSTGNKKNTIDLFCTHDFQMLMLLLFIFGNNQENMNKILTVDYPLMSEGIFLWGNRKKINASCKGKIKIL
jgi:broad specificity phosphatase PhoE